MTGIVSIFNRRLLEVSPQWLGTKIGNFTKKAMQTGNRGGIKRAGQSLKNAEAHIKHMVRNVEGVPGLGRYDKGPYSKYMGVGYRGGWGTPVKRLKQSADDVLVKRKEWVSPITSKKRSIRLNPQDYS